MIDMMTNRPFVVRTTPGRKIESYVFLAVDQLDAVKSVLDRNGISFWVDMAPFPTGQGSLATAINIDRDVSPEQVQRVLDEAQV